MALSKLSFYTKVGINRVSPDEPIQWVVVRYMKAGAVKGKPYKYLFEQHEGNFSRAEWAAEYVTGRNRAMDQQGIKTKAFVVFPVGVAPPELRLIDWKYDGPA